MVGGGDLSENILKNRGWVKAKVVHRGGGGFEGVTTPAPPENFNHTLIHFDLSGFMVMFHLSQKVFTQSSNFCNASGLVAKTIISSAYIRHEINFPFGRPKSEELHLSDSSVKSFK